MGNEGTISTKEPPEKTANIKETRRDKNETTTMDGELTNPDHMHFTDGEMNSQYNKERGEENPEKDK
eukprot:2213886-Prorocentrum_lima.AAC.1